MGTTAGLRTQAAENFRAEIESRRRALEAELAARRIPVVATAGTLLNAVFVTAPEDRVGELGNLAGVRAVVPLRRYRRSLNRAVDLARVTQAWQVLGGAGLSGFGQKIGILDTGIEHTHPAFNDETLAPPPGYPVCSGEDCNFTNNKIIVARSYVRLLAAGTSQSDPAADSRPDDYTPRDREGHGTAVASVAAASGSTGPISFRGAAPKAWIGNYKIYGSPGVNDFTTDDVIIQALEDAIRDGMDIISFSTGGPAFTGALDSGEACGRPAGVPCDLVAAAFESAARAGVIIVAAAGNEGNDGIFSPAYGSLASPANAPSVIAVGASSNSHYFLPTVSLADEAAPASLKGIETRTGDAYLPYGALKAPLRDVAALDGNGLGCGKLPDYSLLGTFALVLRGDCLFSQKVANAEAAGALGVILYMADDSPLVSPGGLGSSWTPTVMISNAAGRALKAYPAEHPKAELILDPNGT
ncbi:MAG: S8 family serine peptidase, partial [Anaerolineae bacterium]|nr:S8 family serine peptidase [Anaerolineae bacterium]